MITNIYFIIAVLWISFTWITLNYNSNNWTPYAEVVLIHLRANQWLIFLTAVIMHLIFWPIILLWAIKKRLVEKKQLKDLTLDIEVFHDDTYHIGKERWN